MNRYDARAKEVGKRIKRERERLKLSQQSLLSKIFKSESSGKMLRAWENGERLPDLDSLVRMADLFGCDVGYLLCDYNERTRDCADICKISGLSEKAAAELLGFQSVYSIHWRPEFKDYKERGQLSKTSLLSRIMEDKKFFSVLRHIQSSQGVFYGFDISTGENSFTGSDYMRATEIIKLSGEIALKKEDAETFFKQAAINEFTKIVDGLKIDTTDDPQVERYYDDPDEKMKTPHEPHTDTE